MKFLSLGVVASAFAIVCVTGNEVGDFGAGLVSFDSLIPVNSQVGGTQVDAFKRRARLSRRKLADAISGLQGIRFIRRGHGEQEPDENEQNGNENENIESEADENEPNRNENEANEQAYVSKASVSSAAKSDQTENEPKEVEASENEPNSLDDEFKEPNENENEPKENEPQENENELKENEPKENENELKESEPNENEYEPKEHEAKENETEPKEYEPEENEMGIVGEDINTTEMNDSESNVVEVGGSTDLESVQLQSYESSGQANVREKQRKNKNPTVNRLGVVNSLYGDASDDDLVYYGVKTPVFNDNIENDAEIVDPVFHSLPEDLLMDDVPYEYKPIDNKSTDNVDNSIQDVKDIESLPIDQQENNDVINLDAPAYYPPTPPSVENESPINEITIEKAPVDSTEKDTLQVENKPPKALKEGSGFSYSVSGHEVYSEDGDEFESLEDQMENMLDQLSEKKGNSQNDEIASETNSRYRITKNY